MISCDILDDGLSLLRIGGVYLRGNQLTKLDYQMFDGMRFADTIDVSHNQIVEVEKNVFKELYLATINMSYNQIERIPAGTFIQCDNLTLGTVQLLHFISSRLTWPSLFFQFASHYLYSVFKKWVLSVWFMKNIWTYWCRYIS